MVPNIKIHRYSYYIGEYESQEEASDAICANSGCYPTNELINYSWQN